MKRFTILCLLLSPWLRADDSARGGFERFVQGRPLMSWEAVKGYRLFFHPDDPEPMRRSLSIAIPTDRKIASAYSLVRPLKPNPDFKDAWMRIEGEIQGDRVLLSWDGMYRGAVFPDTAYYYEIHVRWADGDALDETVAVLKSLEHPKLISVGGEAFGEHPLQFRKGEYEAMDVVARVPRGPVAVVARVYAPAMEGAFENEGIQLSCRRVEDEQGRPARGALEWNCACQQPLPADSPARLKSKKVRCDWDASGVEPGVYELRLSLYHKMKHPGQFDPCDTPILDEDRVRVMVTR